MKILLLGDASNYHHVLATGLTHAGHDVTVASNGSKWMDTHRDIDLSRREGKIGGALFWLKLNTLLWPDLKGYDIVQLCGPIFIEQRPGRILRFFDRLRRANGGVFLTALANDPQFVGMCISPDCPLRYNEWMVSGSPTPYAAANPGMIDQWLSADMRRLSEHIYAHVDGVATALYEYHLSVSRHIGDDRSVYAGIPIDTAATTFHQLDISDRPVNILWAAHKGREAIKGADRLLKAMQSVTGRSHGDATLQIVQNVPLAQFNQALDRADIVVDQLYSYTPATTALMAMAKGKVVVSGAEPEYYDFIHEPTLRPIINPDPTDLAALERRLLHLISDPRQLGVMSRQGRQFVEKHNDALVVARRFESLWSKCLNRV